MEEAAVREVAGVMAAAVATTISDRSALRLQTV
jgi:hypothetical protein